MNNYETVFILNPVLSEVQIEEAVKKYESLFKSNKCKILNKENWGLKKLAYPIQNKNSGFYHLIQFEGGADVIDSIEIELRRDERVMRYLTVKLDLDVKNRRTIKWKKRR